jgi:DNA-binding transcriptional regulator LsrR (DeoR family)
MLNRYPNRLMRITTMATRPISMSKLHAILRLKYSANLSHREIARSLNISPGTVANYVKKANEQGLNEWPIPKSKQDSLGHTAQLITPKCIAF